MYIQPEIEPNEFIEIINIIYKNLNRKIDISSLSGKAKLSSSHFHRLISKELNEPVGKFIQSKKVEFAAKVIASTRIPLKEVKHLIGYSNDSGFIKAFKRFYGISPYEFRCQFSFNQFYNSEIQEFIKEIESDFEIVQLKLHSNIVAPAMLDYYDVDFLTFAGQISKIYNLKKSPKMALWGSFYEYPQLTRARKWRFDNFIVNEELQEGENMACGKYLKARCDLKISQLKNFKLALILLADELTYRYRIDNILIRYNEINLNKARFSAEIFYPIL